MGSKIYEIELVETRLYRVWYKVETDSLDYALKMARERQVDEVDILYLDTIETEVEAIHVKANPAQVPDVSRPGVGVMLAMLAGDDVSEEVVKKAIGKKIAAIVLDKDSNQLRITFADDTRLVMWDNGQQCCESRYMHTDDDLPYFIGSEFRGAALHPGPSEQGEYDDSKDSEFLIISTSLGQFTVVNYNEHNGYYGGFWIRAVEEKV